MTAPPDLSRALSDHPRGSVLSLTVATRSSVNRLELRPDGTLRLRVTAPPVDGAANAALLKFLSRALGVPLSQLSIASGASSRRKRIAVEAMAADILATRLSAALA